MAWSLGSIIREQARRQGERPMITYGARTITWAEMHDRSSRVAQGFLAAGLPAQSRVAFLDKNHPAGLFHGPGPQSGVSSNRRRDLII